MGNILLARILEYLNGTLLMNDYYRFCMFFVKNYLNFYQKTLDEVSEESHIHRESILSFVRKLGFDSFEAFQDKLYADVLLRTDQIRSRMLGLKLDDLFKQIHLADNEEECVAHIDDICHRIADSKRIILMGALYPMSIAVEFQTDLTVFGKPVYQYHAFDHELVLSKDDFVIFMSATGRAMEKFNESNGSGLDLHDASTLLITQNPQFVGSQVADDVLLLPSSRHDSIDFNYRLMTVFDIMRVTYYKKYHFI